MKNKDLRNGISRIQVQLLIKRSMTENMRNRVDTPNNMQPKQVSVDVSMPSNIK